MTASIDSPQSALRLLDPQIASVVGHEIVRDLLGVVVGESPTDRALTMEQTQLLARGRVFPLIPSNWHLPAAFNPREGEELAMLSLHLEASLRRIAKGFNSEGVNFRVLKGIATGHLDYASPMMRHTGDLDILIPPDEFDAARAIVVNLGFVKSAGTSPFHFKGETLADDAGIEVDMHVRLNNYSAQDSAVLFDDPVLIPDLSASALSGPGRLVHAASHLYLTPPGHRRASGLADIAALRSTEGNLRDVQILAQKLGVEEATWAGLMIESQISQRNSDDLASWRRPSGLLAGALSRETFSRLAFERLRLSVLDDSPTRARYVLHRGLSSLRTALDKR